MGKRIGIYVERNTLNNAAQMNGILKLSHFAQRLGHRTDFLFRPDIHKIKEYDAIYIRAFTDPLNAAYVAARTAELHGVRVIDDSSSILICCDKVAMYRRLAKAGVPFPETLFLKEEDLNLKQAAEVLQRLGDPVVLKAANGSFSMYVEKVHNPEDLVKTAKRYIRRSDRVVAQRFIKSQFDWRVGMLGGQPLYVCQYAIPKKYWKIATYNPDGRNMYGPVKGVSLAQASPRLLEVAANAAAAIGGGLYGGDLKQVGDDFVVIEVNDNPTINAEDEDSKASDLYDKIIQFLTA